jgi:hypothetical protein
MVMYGQLITVMYTGGTRIFPRHETSPSNGSSSESSQSHHGPGPDQPVGAIKLYYLTDDHLKVNNQFNNFRCHWDRRWTIKVHSNKSILLVTVTIGTAVIS